MTPSWAELLCHEPEAVLWARLDSMVLAPEVTGMEWLWGIDQAVPMGTSQVQEGWGDFCPFRIQGRVGNLVC